MVKKKLIFIPTDEDKAITSDCVHKVIDLIEGSSKNNLGMKVFIMDTLIDSFKDAFDVDLRYESTTHYKR